MCFRGAFYSIQPVWKSVIVFYFSRCSVLFKSFYVVSNILYLLVYRLKLSMILCFKYYLYIKQFLFNSNRIAGGLFVFVPKPDDINGSYVFVSLFLLRSLLYFVACGVVLCVYICFEAILRVIFTCIKCCKHQWVSVQTLMLLSIFFGLFFE